MRESHTKLESRSQREELERLLDSIDKTLESHNKILFRHGTNISELQGSTQGAQGQIDALEGRLTRVEDQLGRVKEEIARNASAVESAPFTAVEEINPGTGISDERSSVEPRRRYLRESTGTNAPETAFTWEDLNGEGPTPVGNQRNQEVQTFSPGAEPSFLADAKVGEGVRSWRAGRYQIKGGSGDGGDGSGSDGSGDESKRKRSNSTD